MDPDAPPTSKRRLTLAKWFDTYWRTGGFPEVLDVPDSIRVMTHQEYLHAILYRDVVERHDIAHPRAVADLAAWLIDNTASTCTINSLTGYLSSLGHKMPKPVVGNLLEWFEDAYFLFITRVFDASLARSNTNPKKIYCIDHALVRSVSSGVLVNDGHLLENIVFLALRRKHAKIFYYKSKNGREVDFTIHGNKGVELTQVCDSLTHPATRERELKSLTEAMMETGTKTATIITRSEEGVEQTQAGTILIQPAWHWLLECENYGHVKTR